LFSAVCHLEIARDIHEAAQNLDRPNQLFADAVDARQVKLSDHLLETYRLLSLYDHFQVLFFGIIELGSILIEEEIGSMLLDLLRHQLVCYQYSCGC